MLRRAARLEMSFHKPITLQRHFVIGYETIFPKKSLMRKPFANVRLRKPRENALSAKAAQFITWIISRTRG